MVIDNNYLMHTPVGHLDEFDLQALKDWKAGLLGLPKMLQDTQMIGAINARIVRLEVHMKGRKDV